MNEAQMFAESAKTNKKVGGKKARSPGKGRVKCIQFLHLKRKEDNGWEYSKKLTGIVFGLFGTGHPGKQYLSARLRNFANIF